MTSWAGKSRTRCPRWRWPLDIGTQSLPATRPGRQGTLPLAAAPSPRPAVPLLWWHQPLPLLNARSCRSQTLGLQMCCAQLSARRLRFLPCLLSGLPPPTSPLPPLGHHVLEPRSPAGGSRSRGPRSASPRVGCRAHCAFFPHPRTRVHRSPGVLAGLGRAAAPEERGCGQGPALRDSRPPPPGPGWGWGQRGLSRVEREGVVVSLTLAGRGLVPAPAKRRQKSRGLLLSPPLPSDQPWGPRPGGQVPSPSAPVPLSCRYGKSA